MTQTQQRRKPTNLTLPADLRIEARSYAAKRDLSLSQLVTQSLRAVIAADRNRAVTGQEAHAA